MKKFLEEFKSFALRGNVMDMAVGVSAIKVRKAKYFLCN